MRWTNTGSLVVWHSIQDKRPEPYETVLVTDGESIEQATYINGFEFCWLSQQAYLFEDKITHWTKYPQLP